MEGEKPDREPAEKPSEQGQEPTTILTQPTCDAGPRDQTRATVVGGELSLLRHPCSPNKIPTKIEMCILVTILVYFVVTNIPF